MRMENVFPSEVLGDMSMHLPEMPVKWAFFCMLSVEPHGKYTLYTKETNYCVPPILFSSDPTSYIDSHSVCKYDSTIYDTLQTIHYPSIQYPSEDPVSDYVVDDTIDEVSQGQSNCMWHTAYS